jgi:hypothetical protein
MKYTEGKWKLRSHNTNCCLIEVVNKEGLTIDWWKWFFILLYLNHCKILIKETRDYWTMWSVTSLSLVSKWYNGFQMRKFNIVWKGIMSTIYISLFLFFGQVNSQTNFYRFFFPTLGGQIIYFIYKNQICLSFFIVCRDLIKPVQLHHILCLS